MVQLRIIDQQNSNRFGYEKPFDDFIELTDKLQKFDSQEKRKIAIINKALADQRPHALDHERTGEMFHGAALVKTRQGRWFLQANIQAQNPEITRSCAEANAIIDAHGREGKELEVEELWFMGGKANYDIGQAFMDNIGQRNYPCGSCLDTIYNHRMRVGKDTIVHMVPLNDGTMELLSGDPNDPRDAKDIEPNRIFSRKISDLLPHVTYQLSDPSGAGKSMMKKGYEWIHNPEAWIAIGTALHQKQLVELQRLIELQQLENGKHPDDDRLRAVNKLLMDTARDYYQDADVKPKSMTIAIVRATDGNYYISKHTREGGVPATPTAEFEAIGEMFNDSSNKRLTDVFLVSFDQKELQALSDVKDTAQNIPLYMPDGATREILKKSSSRDKFGIDAQIHDFFGKIMDSPGGNVHVFLPNDPHSGEFNPSEHVISKRISELLPAPWKNPKNAIRERH